MTDEKIENNAPKKVIDKSLNLADTTKNKNNIPMLTLGDVENMSPEKAKATIALFDGAGKLRLSDTFIQEALKNKIENKTTNVSMGRDHGAKPQKENEFNIEEGDIIDYMYNKWLLKGLSWCLTKADKYINIAGAKFIEGWRNAGDKHREKISKIKNCDTNDFFKNVSREITDITEQRIEKSNDNFDKEIKDIKSLEEIINNGYIHNPEIQENIKKDFGDDLLKTSLILARQNNPKETKRFIKENVTIYENMKKATALVLQQSAYSTINSLVLKKLENKDFAIENDFFKETIKEELNKVTKNKRKLLKAGKVENANNVFKILNKADRKDKDAYDNLLADLGNGKFDEFDKKPKGAKASINESEKYTSNQIDKKSNIVNAERERYEERQKPEQTLDELFEESEKYEKSEIEDMTVYIQRKEDLNEREEDLNGRRGKFSETFNKIIDNIKGEDDQNPNLSDTKENKKTTTNVTPKTPTDIER